MKRYIILCAAALALAFTGCTGGGFVDPGMMDNEEAKFGGGGFNGGGDSSGGGDNTDSGGGITGSIDKKIIGTWHILVYYGSNDYRTSEADILEFRADGKYLRTTGGAEQGLVEFTADGSTLILRPKEEGRRQLIPYSITSSLNGYNLSIEDKTYRKMR